MCRKKRWSLLVRAPQNKGVKSVALEARHYVRVSSRLKIRNPILLDSISFTITKCKSYLNNFPKTNIAKPLYTLTNIMYSIHTSFT